MVTPRNEKLWVERQIRSALQEKSMEDFLEAYDLDPIEVLMYLYESGHLDPEQLNQEEIIE